MTKHHNSSGGMNFENRTRLIYLLNDTRSMIEWEMKGKRSLIGSAKALTSGAKVTGACMTFTPAALVGLTVGTIGTLCGFIIDVGCLIDDRIKWGKIEKQLLEISRILRQNAKNFHNDEALRIFVTVLQTLYHAKYICSAVYHAAAPALKVTASYSMKVAATSAISLLSRYFIPVAAACDTVTTVRYLCSTPDPLKQASANLRELLVLAERSGRR